MSAGSTCGKQGSKFSYILKSNGKDRQDYHVFADTKISSVSGTHKNQLLIFWKLNKIRNMDALNIKAVGRVFTAGVCLDFDTGEGCTDSLHVQLSPST